MSDPLPPLGPLGETPRWCTSCEIHRATVARPLCPICLDDKVKESKR